MRKFNISSNKWTDKWREDSQDRPDQWARDPTQALSALGLPFDCAQVIPFYIYYHQSFSPSRLQLFNQILYFWVSFSLLTQILWAINLIIKRKGEQRRGKRQRHNRSQVHNWLWFVVAKTKSDRSFILHSLRVVARFQYKVWWLVTSQYFEYVIFALILTNTITLAMRVSPTTV